jgi:cytochrome P450
VCDETLRLHTILTEVRAQPSSRSSFSVTRFRRESGGRGISAIHQDPSIYPTRPIHARTAIGRTCPFEFCLFGGSHRRCLGAAFSDYEMRVALAAVVTVGVRACGH